MTVECIRKEKWLHPITREPITGPSYGELVTVINSIDLFPHGTYYHLMEYPDYANDRIYYHHSEFRKVSTDVQSLAAPQTISEPVRKSEMVPHNHYCSIKLR